jgi:putative ABC transport system permease protein
MLEDLRFALRMLRKQPGFTWIAALTLALGIGATAAVFSLMQGVLLTPPPYRDPGRLVLISRARLDGQKLADEGWSDAQWTQWQTQSKALEAIAAYSWRFNFLISSDGSESLEGMAVTPGYFRVMGLEPMLGRAFSEAEAGATPAPVIVLGYELWQRKFNGDRNIIGRKIRISRRDTPPTVIGVMPPGVRFLPSPENVQEPNYNVNALADFWMPAARTPTRWKRPDWNIVARLKSGTMLQRAQAELALVARRQAQADHDFEGTTPKLESLTSELNHDGDRILWPLLGSAVLVLLIACGNAAALLLVRGLQRQQEYAVRSALGVGRLALFRQVAVESLLLALGGGALGMGLAFGIVKVFKLIGADAIPRLDAVTAGWPVLAGGLSAAVLAAVLAGLVPALRASRLDPIHILKSAGPNSSAGRGERRLLRGVAMAQTALTLALLVGAGLLIRTMSNLAKVQAGYNVGRVLTMSVTSVEGDWTSFHMHALERIAALPGVEHVAFAWGLPLTGNNWPATVEIEGQPVARKESDRLSLPLRSITPDYFDVLGLKISEGRGFRSTDTRQAPGVAVVNRSFAERYFPHTSPIGKKLWFGGGRNRPASQIVGVAANSRTADLSRSPQPEIYLSLWQASAFSKHLAIRTTADPRLLIDSVRRALHSVEPAVAIENVKTLEQIRADSLASRTFAMQLLIGFSIVGSVLTLVGIYGVLSLSVASRRRELAIRAAVGAARRDLRKLIFAEGFRLIVGGVIAGIALALLFSRILRSFLFEVQPNDPITLIAVGALFAGVALLACWAPTQRATKVDPVETLRYS